MIEKKKTELILEEVTQEKESESEEITGEEEIACNIVGIKETIIASSELRSKKFIAYLVAVITGLVGFVVVYIGARDANAFYKYLDFVLYALIAYISGNFSSGFLSKMGKK